MKMDEEYRRLFDKLPEEVRAISEKIAVKQMVIEAKARELEKLSASLTAFRNELQVSCDELESLKSDLREACRKHAEGM
jgi:chromosome segregation ATPase